MMVTRLLTFRSKYFDKQHEDLMKIYKWYKANKKLITSPPVSNLWHFPKIILNFNKLRYHCIISLDQTGMRVGSHESFLQLSRLSSPRAKRERESSTTNLMRTVKESLREHESFRPNASGSLNSQQLSS